VTGKRSIGLDYTFTK